MENLIIGIPVFSKQARLCDPSVFSIGQILSLLDTQND